MSFLVRDTKPVLGGLTLEAVDSPPDSPSGLQGPIEGQIWNDIIQRNIATRIGNTELWLDAIVLSDSASLAVPEGTFTTETTSAAETVIYASPTANFFTAQPGLYQAGNNLLNVIGKTLKFRFYGIYSAGAAATLTFKLRANSISGATMATWVSPASAASITNRPWSIVGEMSNVTTGASGTWEVHGILGTQATDATQPLVLSGDANTAAVTGPDLTASVSWVLTVTNGSANAGNTVSVRQVLFNVGN